MKFTATMIETARLSQHLCSRFFPIKFSIVILFPGEDGADVVELVEGCHRGEVVDVEAEYLVAQL